MSQLLDAFAAGAFPELPGPMTLEELPHSASGGAFRLRTADGRSYKLRVCASASKARKLESRLQLLGEVFPPVRARNRQYLLLDYIDGRMIESRDPPELFYQMGRLHGLVHRQPCAGHSALLDDELRSNLSHLEANGILGTGERARILGVYLALRQRHAFEFRLDLRDASPRNFIEAGGRVYYVDEEGLGHVRGQGLVRMLRKLVDKAPSKPLRVRTNTQHLIAGYESAGEPAPGEAYLRLVSLYDLVRRLFWRAQPEWRPAPGEEEEAAFDLETLRGLVRPSNPLPVIP